MNASIHVYSIHHSRNLLTKNIFNLLHSVVGLEHHAGRLGVVRLDVLVDLSVIFHEHPHELLQQRFQGIA